MLADSPSLLLILEEEKFTENLSPIYGLLNDLTKINTDEYCSLSNMQVNQHAKNISKVQIDNTIIELHDDNTKNKVYTHEFNQEAVALVTEQG